MDKDRSNEASDEGIAEGYEAEFDEDDDDDGEDGKNFFAKDTRNEDSRWLPRIIMISLAAIIIFALGFIGCTKVVQKQFLNKQA